MEPCCCPLYETGRNVPYVASPAYVLNQILPHDVLVDTIELGGAGEDGEPVALDWQVTVWERSFTLTTGVDFTPQSNTPFVPGRPGGRLRLEIRAMSAASRGRGAGSVAQPWLHDGRGMAVVTGTSVQVRVMAPQGSAVVGAGATLPIAAAQAIDVWQPLVRIAGVPARSREPAKIQIGNMFTIDAVQTLALMPGCSEVWLNGTTAVAGAFGQPAVPVPLRTWTPAEGASFVTFTPTGTPVCQFVQRGYT